MKITRVDLKLKLNPKEQSMYAFAFLTIKKPSPTINLMINNQLQWLEFRTEVKGEKYYFTPEEKSVPKDHFLKSSKIWSIELPKELRNLNELLLSIRYSGQIEPDPWTTNYLTAEGVELGLYVAYYPLLNITDRLSFSLILQGPKGWSWIMNSEKLKDCNCEIWVSDEPKIDLYLIGIPEDEAIDQDEPKKFWGLKRNYDKFADLDTHLEKFYTDLVELLGEPPLNHFKLVLVPREGGGMITRQGIIAMQDNIPENVITENRDILLLRWVHEMCHFWFNKTSVETYHNWIDEALCDYCALFITKFEFGEKFYNNQIEGIKTKIRDSSDLVPLKNITRQHEKADLLFYKYGSLIFHEICEEIGEESFKLFLTEFSKKSLKATQITTKDLVSTLEKINKRDWESFLNEKLDRIPSL